MCYDYYRNDLGGIVAKLTSADRNRFVELVQGWSPDQRIEYEDYNWQWLADADLLDHMAQVAATRADSWRQVAIKAAALRDGTTRNCEGCGESFTPARSDAKYCSPACKQKAYRARMAGGAA